MGKLIATSDIHGCYYSFMSLLEKAGYNEKEDTLVVIGDSIDRGKNSYEVITYLIDLQERVGKDNCICLLGNHEDMMLYDWRSWKIPCNGATFTLSSFYMNKADIKDYYWWFKQLPIVYQLDEIIFCHAGFTYPTLEENTRDDLLWGGGALYFDAETEKPVIFGHYAVKEVVKTPNNNICIDTGGVFGNKFSALIMYDNKDESDIISVPKDERD